MASRSKKPQRKKPRRSKGRQYISISTASLAFALFLLRTDNERIARLNNLAIRNPDLIKALMIVFPGHDGGNAVPQMHGGLLTPAFKEEFIEIVRPVLEEGAKLASFARIFDLYLLSAQPTPESIVETFYIITRYCIAKDQKPMKEQVKEIWRITLSLSQMAPICARHWKELESQGPVHLKGWLDGVREGTRKKFKTFLNQMKRMGDTADQTFKNLFLFLFDGDDKTR